MVELYLNGKLCDLYGNETIATDYSIAPISDITSRTTAKSVTFRMPLTTNNRAIIDNANVIVNDTTLPYRLIPAQLKTNGLDQNIRYAQIKSVRDDVEAVLFGSNIDFFSIVKEKKLSDLGAVWDHAWNLENAHASRSNTNGYIYALIDYHADSPHTGGFIENENAEINVRGLLPSVYLHTLITEIIAQAGFTAQGPFLNDTNYRRVVIPCTEYTSGRYGDYSLVKASSDADLPPSFADFFNFSNIEYDPLNLFDGTTYTAFAPGSYTFSITFEWSGYDPLNVAQIAFSKNGSTLIAGFTVDQNTGSHTFEETVELEAGETVAVTIQQAALATTILAGATFEVTEAPARASFGLLFDVTSNLPDLKQSDLLKDTAQKFGLIFHADNATKTVHIRQFSEIIDNIPDAPDWSGKVDYTEKPELQFESGYAQRNHCTYADDDTVTKPEGTDSEVTIANDNLQAEKELFQSPFAPSEQVERFNGVSIAQIKLFTNLGGEDEEIAGVEPRYLIIRDENFSEFTYTDGTSTETATTVPLTHFILSAQPFNAGFANNLLDNSKELMGMIRNYKTVTMLLRLTAADINQLDFFTPVWIELKRQPGCYYYISKIKQFKATAKESTEVELVKLP